MKSPSYFPKQKAPVIAVLVLAVILIGAVVYGVFLGESQKDTPKKSETGRVSVLAQKTNTTLKKDVDADGLSDWQEMLWGTRVQDSDTDNDGTLDGKEVALKRDPTVAGPDDLKNSLNDQSASTSAEIRASLNKNQLASRQFFARYLAIRKAGLVNENTGERLALIYAGDVLKGFEDEPLFKTYATNDIAVSEKSGSAALHTYANKMGAILENVPNIPGSQTGLEIYSQAVRTRNPNKFKSIQPYVDRYESIIQRSLAVPVPQEALEVHLDYLGAMSALKDQARAMRNMKETPIQSGLILQKYVENKEQNVFRAFNAIENFYKNEGITFSTTEPGFIFTHFGFKQNNI